MSASSAQQNAWNKRLILTADDGETSGEGKATVHHRAAPSPRPTQAPPPKSKHHAASSSRKPSPLVFNLLDSLLAAKGNSTSKGKGIAAQGTSSTSSAKQRRGKSAAGTQHTAASQRTPQRDAPKGQHVASRVAKPKRPSAIKRAVLQRRHQVVGVTV